MVTVEQAYSNLDGVLSCVRNPALTRKEHDILRVSLNVLYEKAQLVADDKKEE